MENNFIKIHKWLYPVSWLYGAGVWIRNRLFDWGIYKEKSFDIPVISVGNILFFFYDFKLFFKFFLKISVFK